MMRYASFGSISHGTMRHEDLIPCFSAELDALLKRQPRSFKRGEYRKLIREANALTDYDSEDAGHVLEELFDALQSFAPGYAYFGSHPGDGADYGFWLCEDLGGFDGLKVGDLSDVPKDYRGEVLHINDHGNLSLYVAHGRMGRAPKFREVWALV